MASEPIACDHRHLYSKQMCQVGPNALHFLSVWDLSGTIDAVVLSFLQAIESNNKLEIEIKPRTTYKLDKEVFLENPRRFVLIDDVSDLWVTLDITFKQVEWRVIPIE